MRWFRHVAALGGLTVLVLTGYHYAAQAHPTVASLDDGIGGDPGARSDFSTSYSLSRLSILDRSINRVELQYVDPERVDREQMFESALKAVERLVPEVLLRADGQRVHVQVGDYSTVLQTRTLDDPDVLSAELKRVAQILEEHLSDPDLKFEDVEYALVNGMLSTLDPHSVLLPPENAKKMEEDNEGEFGGLGINIRIDQGQLMIEYPLPDTPASRAGLKAGDRIVKIDGEGTINMNIDDAVEKMRGPSGTIVTLTIQREGFTTPRDFSIERAQIKTGRVWSQLLDGNVGYVRIDSFHQQVETQLDEELARLGRQAGPGGLKGLVLDLRDNPGGFLHQAVAVADTFLSKGVIVATVGREGGDREEKTARASGTEPNYPMAVLMSHSSASAAEIVAGALKNNERAVIVGERSFGKGSVQELYPMDDQARLKLTVARYLTPGDHSIQMIGIPPDIELDRSYVAGPRPIPEFDTTSGPRISLFARDHLLREADLQGHLVNGSDQESRPVYSLRYLAKDAADETRTSDHKDVAGDIEVLIARDVLMAARGGRRADVLRDASTVVAARQRSENARIEQAFRDLKIDWSACANPPAASVDLALSFASSGGASRAALRAGELTTAKLTAHNTGAQPLCRVAVHASSEHGNDQIDGLEFYLGRLEPGATRTYEAKLLIPEGYPTEDARVRLEVKDATRTVLAHQDVVVRTEGDALPRYAWSWKIDDHGGGDGDGVAEVGETVALALDVTNLGEGAGGDLSLSLRKDPLVGKAVELETGTVELHDLAPGATAAGRMVFTVRSTPPQGGIPFELSVRDSSKYDYASVMKAEFYAFFSQTEKFTIPVGTLPPTGRREPPAIQITRAPAGVTSDPEIIVSGVATDDAGLRDVIVYRGDEKIAFAGGGDAAHALTSVPFSANARLEEGNNLVVVLVRDVDGLTTTRAVDVLYTPPVTAAASVPAAPAEPAPAGR